VIIGKSYYEPYGILPEQPVEAALALMLHLKMPRHRYASLCQVTSELLGLSCLVFSQACCFRQSVEAVVMLLFEVVCLSGSVH
jgi:hypothetical protein